MSRTPVLLVVLAMTSCGRGSGGSTDTGIDLAVGPDCDARVEAVADEVGDPGPGEPGGDTVGPDAQPPTPEEVRARIQGALSRDADATAFAAMCDEVAVTLGAPAAADGEPADARQARCLRALAYGLDLPAGWVRTRGGVLRKARLDLEVPKADLRTNPTAHEAAMRLLRAASPVLRVPEADRAFRLIRSDTGPSRGLMFRQYARDVPVYGGWVEVRVIEGTDAFVLRGLAGRYVPDLPLPGDEEPPVSAAGAVASIAKAQGLDPAEIVTAAPPRLWVFDEALFEPECLACPTAPNRPRLAWRVVYASPSTGGVVVDAFVDAVKGALLHHVPRTDGEDIRILTASNQSSSTCYVGDCRVGIDPWYDEDGLCQSWTGPCWGDNHCWWGRLVFCAEPDAEGVAAQGYVRSVYQFFREKFPSHADLGVDNPFKVYLHACWKNYACPLENAGSNGCLSATDIHTFGTGWATMDIIGHEAGHTWHRSHVDYVYRGESGATAEHVSDMFGTFAACYSGIDCDWWHGEHTHGAVDPVCGRNLQDPGECSDPDHYDDYDTTTSDNGGVHTNSGILNKAGYLMTEGGVHPVSWMEVRGLGLAKVMELYRVAVPGLPESPAFEDVAERFSAVCDSLVGGDHGITDDDCCQVRKAFAAVGLGVADSDCDGTPDDIEFDADDDGVNSPPDNCPFIANPDQADLDGDGEGDACEDNLDGDAFRDEVDLCPRVHGRNDDSDGDGIGDVCEDNDGDGIVDNDDICPELSNPDQADLDGDGEGDRCDDDIDGDMVRDDGSESGVIGDDRCAGGQMFNCDDNCRFVGNGDQADGDGDAIGDACDNCPALASSDRRDLDEDGLGDPCDDDRDGDGFANDVDECPEDAAPRTGIAICPSGYSCRQGCKDVLAVVPGLAARVEASGIADVAAGDGPLPVLGLALDPCEFLDCGGGKAVLDAELSLRTKVSMALDPSMTMDAPVTVGLVLVDESGHKLASREVRLIVGMDEVVTDADVELHSRVNPSHNRRYTIGLPTPEPEAAAVPAMYLQVLVVPGNAANQELLRTVPISLTVAGGSDEPIEALKECARLGLGDFVALMKAFLSVVDQANTPGDPTPTVLDMSIDVNGPGAPMLEVEGVVTGSDLSDGMQLNEVAVFTWTGTLNGQAAGGGKMSFVKLSDDNTFRATIVGDTTLDVESGCGPFALTMLGLHAQSHLQDPSLWYGMLGATVSVDGHTLEALVTFTSQTDGASLTGETDAGTKVEMEIDFASL